MLSFLFSVGLNPCITAPLLWSLTLAPPAIRHRLISQLARYTPAKATPRGVIHALVYLFTLGIVRKLNKWLNAFAVNHWRLKSDESRWNWHEEVAVVTGGSGGIGAMIVARLVSRGVKVVILDVQAPVETCE